jgi:antirestriction protein ArdC
MKQEQDTYSIVTERIIRLLEQGVVPWRKPWTAGNIPCNLITLRPYRGINLLLLNMEGYNQNYFLSFRQVKALGGFVKKDEKAHLVVFWKPIQKKKSEERPEDQDEKKERTRYVLRYYYVFNIEQCTGIEDRFIPKIEQHQHDPITACEEIIANMPEKPEIRHDENRAYYHKKHDYVNMPDFEYFVKAEAYYATLFHELVHSTGHEKRLNRKEIMEDSTFGDEMYSQEELVAEFGSCYLQSYSGAIHDNMVNSAAYIDHWIRVLKGNTKFIVHASSAAQKACDYILNINPPNQDEELTIAHHEPISS